MWKLFKVQGLPQKGGALKGLKGRQRDLEWVCRSYTGVYRVYGFGLGVSKIYGSSSGVLTIRIMVFWGLHWVPPNYLGKLPCIVHPLCFRHRNPWYEVDFLSQESLQLEFRLGITPTLLQLDSIHNYRLRTHFL